MWWQDSAGIDCIHVKLLVFLAPSQCLNCRIIYIFSSGGYSNEIRGLIWFINIVMKGTIYWPYEQNFRTVSTGSRTGQEGQGKFLAQTTYL